MYLTLTCTAIAFLIKHVKGASKKFPAVRFWWFIITHSLHSMIDTIMVSKNCLVIDEHVIIFVTQQVTIATVLPAKNKKQP